MHPIITFRATILALCTFVCIFTAAGDHSQNTPELRSDYPKPIIYYDDGIFSHEEPFPVRTWGPSTSYTADINVTRYYGNQQERNRQIQLGLMPKYATLSILAGDCDVHATRLDTAPEIDIVYFNGREVGILDGENDLWILNTFLIPCQEVNFPSAPGEIGKNKLEILVDTANKERTWYLDQQYQYLDISGPWPIFLVHGWTTNTRAMATIQNLVSQHFGIPSELGEAPMDNSPRTNGKLLASQLDTFTASYGVSKFNVIAHSKGGLDSRALIDQCDVDSPHVNHLFQISTPNAGSYLANILIHPEGFSQNSAVYLAKLGNPAYAQVTDGLRSLTIEACSQFNQTHSHPNTTISTIIGRVRNFQPFDDHDDNEDGWDMDGGWNYYRLGKFSYGHDYHSQDPARQGDGIVSVLSAHAIHTQVKESPLDSPTTNFAHNNIIEAGAPTVLAIFQNALMEKPKRNMRLAPNQPELRSGNALNTVLPVTLEGISLGDSVAEEASTLEEIPSTFLVKSTLVEAQQEAQLHFDLNAFPSPEPEFLFLRIPANVNLQVISPTGQRYDVPSETADTAKDDADNPLALLGGRILTLPKAPSGIYIVRIANSDETPIYATVACRARGKTTEIDLQFQTECTPTMPCEFTISLQQDGKCLPYSQFPMLCRCQFLRDGSESEALSESVEIPLEATGEGRYHGSFVPQEEGEYLLTATWLDAFGEVAFLHRERIFCCTASGTILPCSTTGEKIPSDFSPNPYGMWGSFPDEKVYLSQALRMPFDTTVSRAGQYFLSADLYSLEGQHITSCVQRQTATQAGKLHFVLDFDGSAIYASQTDGPYWIKNIQLGYLGENGMQKIIAYGSDQMTDSFPFQDFLHTPMSLIGLEREWLEKHQENEQDTWTSLHLLTNLEIAKGILGPLRISATISCPNGLKLRSIITDPIEITATAEADAIVPVEFVFDTTDFLEKGAAGSFCLSGLYAYSESTCQTYQCPGEVQTRQYRLDQFEQHLTTVCLKDLKGMELTWTSDPDNLGTYSATLTFTRFNLTNGGPDFFLKGVPLMEPFGLAVEDNRPNGFQLVHAQSIVLNNQNYQYLDCTAEALEQLNHQGNQDEWLDEGETVTITFQYTQDTPVTAPPEIRLVARMPAPLGRRIAEKYLRHCLITDLDQDFRITQEEVDAARQRWKDDEISHAILLKTIEFSKAPGYRYSTMSNDFEPLESDETGGP